MAKRLSKPIRPSAFEASIPAGRVLGNGRYCVLVTPAGTGFSWFEHHLLSKWDGDRVVDGDGFLLWLRDAESGEVCTAGLDFTSAGDGGASWEPGCFEIQKEFAGLRTRLEMTVSADHAFELRRLSIQNDTSSDRTLEITSQIEIALSDPAAFAAHPSFSKLFIETEMDHSAGALLAKRRARDRGEQHPWLVHAMDGRGESECETDRARFFRRGDFGRVPHAVACGERLSGTFGNVLDPMFALRRRIVVASGAEGKITFLLGAAHDRASALRIAGVLEDASGIERVFERAKDRESAHLDSLAITLDEADDLQSHAGVLFYGAAGASETSRYREVERAERYLASLGAPLERLALPASIPAPSPPSSSARSRPAAPSLRKENAAPPSEREDEARSHEEELLFFNGFGGFTKAGDEYVIRIAKEESGGLRLPPRPWINVIANERFGFLVSETGAGMTWSENSREHRLTPWGNDPLLDPHGEAIYIRDESSGSFWSPFPGPAPGAGDYEVRHGFGRSVFLHHGQDLEERTEVFVPSADSVKITSIHIRNRSPRARTLSLFAYARLVLGGDPRHTARWITTGEGPYPGSMFAENAEGGDFASRSAFAGFAARANVRAASAGGDRESFLGMRGSLSHPEALSHEGLDGKTGGGLDPCFAQQVVIDLAPGEEANVVFLLGDAPAREAAEELLARYSRPETIDAEREAVLAAWRFRLSAIHLETPSPALDLLMNGWLMDQVIACRLWARSALYQSGGAFGFRDQLQDATALALVHPELAREQLLLHAAHQFTEGDVLHWWHPPKSRGIRTRFADDLLWLPYLAADYVRVTGDEAVLEEEAPFLDAARLEAGEDERYLLPVDSGERASLFEHCVRAIDRSVRSKGAHGLPLFGTGDWNDGMNRVGREGRGESVWMGFFLKSVLSSFAPICEKRGDMERAQRYRAESDALHAALNDAGWDGEWYRRGYYDGGEPLGSRESDECRIDALAQAWAILSATAPAERAQLAMNAVERHLISEKDGLIRLLTPAFRDTPLDPGYIKGYVPGVRENGGQYTHAALWVVAAMAELGRNDRAAALLDLLNPIHHARTPSEVSRYQVEPYVIAADVYGEDPHVGRGGWTWYTGSAGWMLRVALESVLGIRLEGGRTLCVKPCVPDEWPGFTVRLRLPEDGTRLTIRAQNPNRRARAVVAAAIDGRPAAIEHGVARIPIARDGAEHEIEMTLGDVVSNGSSLAAAGDDE